MKTVLVVDDEPRIVELARDYLEHAGFVVLTAVDGPSALKAARMRKPGNLRVRFHSVQEPSAVAMPLRFCFFLPNPSTQA